MSNSILNAISLRRSIYNLSDIPPINDGELENILTAALQNTPSAFNSQSSRLVVLLHDNHQKLWNITSNALKKLVPEDKFAQTQEKIESFAKGYGTILYFEDEKTILDLQKKFPLYKDKFPSWSEQASGMLQYMVWTLLAEKNIGASLQHYNPLIDNKVKQMWKLPKSWKLIAQMPFGRIMAPAEIKTTLPVSERLKIFI